MKKSMKKLLLMILLVCSSAVVSTASASPFVVSDPTSQKVTHCGILLDNGAKVEVPVVTVSTTTAMCKYDIGSVTVGNHSISATFINNDALWGRSESVTSVPLSFVRPNNVIANPPTGLDVSK